MCGIPSAWKSIYMVGIGGIGMSALARYFRECGRMVAGYDRTPSPLTRQLEQEGISVCYDEDPALLPERTDLLVYTPAVPSDHAQLVRLREMGVPCMKRAEVLGLISRDLCTVALAGTHGKTSMSALTTLLLRGDEPLTAFIGGIAANFQSNLVYETGARRMVVEADEFDRSFLQLHPDVAVISSMDADHLDIYHTVGALREAFDAFSQQIKPGGCLITKPELTKYLHPSVPVLTYSLHDASADFRVEGLQIADGCSRFDVRTPDGVLHDLLLPTAGLYNVENALAAVAVACRFCLPEVKIRERLAQYKGVKRRFEYIIRKPDRVYVDDYAHHPKELEACIASARRWYPQRRICGVFQPHLYTRTRDFAGEFADALSQLDTVVLLDIYPAREAPIPGVSSQLIFDRIHSKEKYCCTKEQLLPLLEKLDPEVLLTMGAGDIDRLVDKIKTLLS
ncbi:MAG: UDP-N-acetylmuramate--L-alanine ligase [Bacteroidales bacterium]|nr:UDP-N-acetylmuramate--L-alanine ligase [Bacteroidales bacterium]